MYCRKCGIENPDEVKYCRRCGEFLAGAGASAGDATYVPPTYAPLRRGITSIDDLPAEYRPIGMWGYFGYNLLFAIPFVGWIIALAFAVGVTSNVNLKNYARAYFCGLIVAIVLLLLVSASGCSVLYELM